MPDIYDTHTAIMPALLSVMDCVYRAGLYLSQADAVEANGRLGDAEEYRNDARLTLSHAYDKLLKLTEAGRA